MHVGKLVVCSHLGAPTQAQGGRTITRTGVRLGWTLRAPTCAGTTSTSHTPSSVTQSASRTPPAARCGECSRGWPAQASRRRRRRSSSSSSSSSSSVSGSGTAISRTSVVYREAAAKGAHRDNTACLGSFLMQALDVRCCCRCCRIFVASRPEQVQFQPEMNCFAKADAFRGQNGWTGKPKSDIWIADSQVRVAPARCWQQPSATRKLPPQQ
jgi:hypothetical protein